MVVEFGNLAEHFLLVAAADAAPEFANSAFGDVARCDFAGFNDGYDVVGANLVSLEPGTRTTVSNPLKS